MGPMLMAAAKRENLPRYGGPGSVVCHRRRLLGRVEALPRNSCPPSAITRSVCSSVCAPYRARPKGGVDTGLRESSTGEVRFHETPPGTTHLTPGGVVSSRRRKCSRAARRVSRAWRGRALSDCLRHPQGLCASASEDRSARSKTPAERFFFTASQANICPFMAT